ncbi:aminodeoxychorismate synthase component I [Methylomonas sp. MO1]|uniref:aminodeoxychorismate synthase component I n=1 Tax=unclassified Methylomonas TaxID=2608980 RepID=UPI00047D8E5A|nr:MULTISPECIES: aminodeoxychorismate synthase component I [unclassified Methylomonas]MDT4291229.1 aminodeoxychorismate synthase component I [Methylomonas sp. MO1]
MPLAKPIKQSLPYFQDSATLFAPLAQQPWAVFLDSTQPHSKQDRFDIIAYAPIATLQTRGNITLIERDGVISESAEDPFELLKQQLGVPLASVDGLPFNGGAIGYFAYDLARRIERLPAMAADAEQLPEMAVGIYRWAVIVDHQRRQSWLVSIDLPESEQQRLIAEFSAISKPADTAEFKVLHAPVANMDKDAYTTAFRRIKHYLKEGDCYQINLTQRFESPCQGDPWQAYQVLRQINAAPFSAYLNFPDVQVLSSSPERFLKVTDGAVETKPIKGTRPRRSDWEEDQAQIEDLVSSTKDRAENVMIVDLLRNDLGKSCKKGSVWVPSLFSVESYTTVHHLVSTVTGQLAAGQHAIDLLRSCFPGGSITGAPKIRAMEIIEELEPHRRGIYCGAIGYIGFDGNMDTNIAIRTLVHNHGTIRFWAGGGIVNDSVLDEEYQECFDKAAALLQLLKQFSA